EGASVGLRVEGGTYLFQGQGTFMLPGLRTSAGVCKIGTGFTFASAPPPVREASLSLSGCLKIPIAQTGFFITKVSGTVTLAENAASVNLALGIEGGPDIPVVGPALSGEPSATWDTSWSVALNGNLRVFSFDVAQAALSLSQFRGLEGTINISIDGMIEGESSLRIWKDTSGFTIAGKATAQVIIPKGKILHQCAFGACLDVPSDRTVLQRQAADFGTFLRNNERIYGLRGAIDLLGLRTTFMIDPQGHIEFGDNLRDLPLLGLSAQGAALQAIDSRQLTVPAGTPALLVGLGFSGAAPQLRLRAPNGSVLTPASPGVTSETTTSQITMVVTSPAAGLWTVEVEGDSPHVLIARGAAPLPTLAAPIVTPAGDGSFTIGLLASSSTPTATLSLFYDTNTGTHTGAQIAAGLPVATTSYSWAPVGVSSGSYYVYAVLDDPLGLPLIADVTQPVTVSDTTAPAPPSQVQATASDGAMTVSWAGSPSADVAGYRLYYREPGGGSEFMSDIADSTQRSYLQRGVFLAGSWTVTLSAYDRSGNESTRSAALTVPITLSNGLEVYLPLLRR
ncbi:MAG: fibronectin type III domain-containing protein, partial [Oscillochloris sp.]|nr:fibronectin type III domain-containing protein [Oscillochloris sp.]